ncbi:aldolase/citrate lyase family protein [Methanolacinia petrolearia]|uniref:aldolase/citrate lyase family protein n=1 Tax=Methanolacinia petrolearia TaxID=54120 RepID=UPI003BAA3CDD
MEAFTDLKMAIHLNADGIIIPMVESEFALIKSINMVRDLIGDACTDFDIFINIETRSAVENLRPILSVLNDSFKGITIGRSDLSYSYGKKGEQDSDFTNEIVGNIVEIARECNINKITVGGGISRKTFNNEYLINNIIPELTNIETRNVILCADSINKPEALIFALDFERKYLNYKLEKNHLFMKMDEDRFETLISRG